MPDPITYDNLIASLVDQVPESRALYEAHLVEVGELLLVGAIATFVETAAASSDPRVIDVILSCFMELFEPGDPMCDAFVATFGPASQRLLALSRS